MRQTAETSDALSPKSEPDAAAASDDLPLTVIEPGAGWQPIHLAELWRCRELIYFLAWRDVKVRYKQTLLGAAWAVLQPILMMAVFTLVFGRMTSVSSGAVAYPLFVYAGLVGWTLFASAVVSAAQSVVSAERLITKVYFPRLAIPLAAIGASLLDFMLASLVLAAMMSYYGQPITWTIFFAPFAALLLLLAAVGFGVALAALNVAYRDVRHVLPFMMQLWLLATPSVYLENNGESGASGLGSRASIGHRALPDRRQAPHQKASPAADLQRQTRNWLAINPLEGLVAFFRSAALGLPLAWRCLIYPTVAITCALVIGCSYFRRVEDSFADII